MLISHTDDNFLHFWDISTTKLRYKFQISPEFKSFSYSNSSIYLSTSIKMIATFTTCLQNLLKLQKDMKNHEKLKLDELILKEKYNISKELMEEALNYGVIPGLDISLIHYLSYRQESDILDLFHEILNHIDFSIIIGFNIDCAGKSPLEIAFESKFKFHRSLFALLIKKPPESGSCPCITLDILKKISNIDPELLKDILKSRFVHSYEIEISTLPVDKLEFYLILLLEKKKKILIFIKTLLLKILSI